MDIYPQDLGPFGRRVLQTRELVGRSRRDAEGPEWARGGFAVGGAGVALSLVVGAVSGSLRAVGLCLLLSGLAAVGGAVRRHWAGARLWTEGPLTLYEVRDVQNGDPDPLRQRYLGLVGDAVNTPPAEAAAQRSVREALGALGESIAGLPPPAEAGHWDDPAAFLSLAAQLDGGAAAEGDPVIAASLRRRAEALRRQAETAARTNTLLRRNEALRQEVLGQIAALRTSLTALQVGGAQAAYELAGVAASIQQVALAAGALTEARAELGEVVSTQAAGEDATAAQAVRLEPR